MEYYPPYGPDAPRGPYKYSPKWEKDVDFNPDHNCSLSGISVAFGVAQLEVRGLGVLILRGGLDEVTTLAAFDVGDPGCPKILKA